MRLKLKSKQGTLKEILASKRIKPSQLFTGFILRRLREMSGISQCDLARHSEANLSYINSIEGGLNNISIRKIHLLCNALHIPPALMIAILYSVDRSADLSAGRQ